MFKCHVCGSTAARNQLVSEVFTPSHGRAFMRFSATEVLPGSAIQNDTALIEYVRAHSYTVHHPVSTCRMGSDDMAVVDPRLARSTTGRKDG